MAYGTAMSPQEVADWLRQQGVAEGVIGDEAGYISSQYADPDEDPLAVLQRSLPGYMQRSLSGGDRSEGGYSTDEGDPAITIGNFTAPARPVAPAPGPASPTSPTGSTSPTSFGSFFDQGSVTGAELTRLDRLFEQVNADFLAAGPPVVDVPGINMNEDIDASLLSLMRGTDTSTQETDTAIRNLLSELEGTTRPEIPERSLEDFYDKDRVNRRMLTATENAQLGQQGLLEQLRAQLGDAGVVSLPGVSQGLETAGARRAAARVAVPFAQEMREIQNQESERALDAALKHLDIQTTVDIARQQGHDARELGALQLATGWSAQKSSRVLQAAAAATDRQRILSEIALETLQTNQAWNAFQATFGLERERFMQDVRAGNLDRIGGIINSFQQFLSQLRGGFVGAQ